MGFTTVDDHPFAGEVVVRLVDLDAYAASTPLEGIPEAERLRAARRPDPLERRRFLASRHALRRLLADSVGIAPERLELDLGPRGKPHLRAGEVRFNLSHAGRWALIGTSRRWDVGVDLEVMAPVRDAAALVEAHFAAAEREAWERATPRVADAAFLLCWTRKEACAKAVGLGVALPMRTLDVGCERPERALTIRSGGVDVLVRVAGVTLPVDAVAAVAIAPPTLH